MDPISDYDIYVYFSCLPKFPEINLKWLNCDFDYEIGEGIDNESWWIGEGVKAFKETITSEISSAGSNSTHILPLSGGLDSRVILGGLLDNLSKSQIITATYGIPGSWDFDIAQTVARTFGLRNEAFNLLNEKWDIDQLVDAASHLKRPASAYQSFIRQKINNHFGVDCTYWSGFMGDSLAGSDLPKILSKNREEAVKTYIDSYCTLNFKDKLFRNEMASKFLLECGWSNNNQTKFPLDQFLEFGIRQWHLTQAVVIIDGYKFKTPFLNKTWVNFISNVPHKWQIGEYLYKRIIHESYPFMWKIPTRNNAGMSLFASKYEKYLGKAIARIKPYIIKKDPFFSHPRINYVNWTESLRHKCSLQKTVCETLEDLKKRSIFKKEDLETWWQDHLNKKQDNTVLLMNLSSLELLIKAGII